MKKVFCFHCQKDVSPLKFWKWQFCPHCLHQTKDNGEGLYLVCDKCGANIPVDSFYCLKCGHGVNGHAERNRLICLFNFVSRRNTVCFSLFFIDSTGSYFGYWPWLYDLQRI